MRQGNVRIKPLISERLPLEKVEDGILMMKERKDIIKIVVNSD
jgi:hypothetical protein